MERTFASDNFSGVDPKIMEKLMEANQGHAFAYGMDPLTIKAKENLKRFLEM